MEILKVFLHSCVWDAHQLVFSILCVISYEKTYAYFSH